MAILAQDVNRGPTVYDSGCPNKWKWEWVSVEVEVKVGESTKKERVGTRFRTFDVKSLKAAYNIAPPTLAHVD